ncbi:hypothetical protein BAR24066_04378 [Burkholderia arboris]|uniref:Uncharacterized protein n=1 Tax=Burkholderia arboris TaxID=488730 RepID=A0A9Q9SL19_9BURK|nr:hypothetical protein BAR24066_04378 [Burkholderia arboris]
MPGRERGPAIQPESMVQANAGFADDNVLFRSIALIGLQRKMPLSLRFPVRLLAHPAQRIDEQIPRG